MSTTVDERIVSMQFDNKNFENNVQTSLGTLDKLKNSLNLQQKLKGTRTKLRMPSIVSPLITSNLSI